MVVMVVMVGSAIDMFFLALKRARARTYTNIHTHLHQSIFAYTNWHAHKISDPSSQSLAVQQSFHACALYCLLPIILSSSTECCSPARLRGRAAPFAAVASRHCGWRCQERGIESKRGPRVIHQRCTNASSSNASANTPRICA
jgi:hypothetical protein